jgi:hypothetical protein
MLRVSTDNVAVYRHLLRQMSVDMANALMANFSQRLLQKSNDNNSKRRLIVCVDLYADSALRDVHQKRFQLSEHALTDLINALHRVAIELNSPVHVIDRCVRPLG